VKACVKDPKPPKQWYKFHFSFVHHIILWAVFLFSEIMRIYSLYPFSSFIHNK
jgi:hypothetical protein